jgi:DNA-directed RNA polymerase subunit E'/Rpb7
LRGVPITFENVRVVSKGSILNELPYIHYKVSCDALVFTPKPGNVLKGTVTESFHSHLSLVVLGSFNASIPARQLRAAEFEFDEANEQWKTPLHGALQVDNTVLFQVTKTYESAGIISMEGSLVRQYT